MVRPAATRTKRKLEPKLDDESPESPPPEVLTPVDLDSPPASTSAIQEASPPVSEPTRQMLFDEIAALCREREMRPSLSEIEQVRFSTPPDSHPVLSPMMMRSANFTLDSHGQFSLPHSIISHHLSPSKASPQSRPLTSFLHARQIKARLKIPIPSRPNWHP